MTLHTELRKRANMLGIKQIDLCNKLNIPVTTMNGYFKGKREPDIETLKRIASALDTTVATLIGDNNTEKQEQEGIQETSDDVAMDLEAMVRELESSQDGLMFNGQSLDIETKNILITTLKHALEMSKKFAATNQPKTTDIINELRNDIV